MKRRGFLGALSGAAIAGPGIAKGAAAGMTTGHMHLGGGKISGGWRGMPYAVEDSVPESDWMTKEIGDLQRRLRGELTDQEKEEAEANRVNLYAVASAEIDAFRSLSPVARARMAKARTADIERRQEKRYLSSRLADLLRKQLGG